MESFHWNKNFMTDLEDIDRQHHHLVNIINQFGSLLAENSISPEHIEKIFAELAAYAQYHFQTEEDLMKKWNVDERHSADHVEKHENFLIEVTFMHSCISKDKLDSAKQLFNFLVHWLVYHILGADKNMARQIKAIQAGIKPADAYEREERVENEATEALLNALNELFEQVSARNRELMKLNHSLEEKVSQRTKELYEANCYLEKLSITDVLTELPNRRYALKFLAKTWEEALKENLPLTCIMVDVDYFKEINDTYGHDAGDLVLSKLSKTLQHSVRNDDAVCRLGGDEFFIICPNTNKEGGLYLAGEICKAVSQLSIAIGDSVWYGSISVGVGMRTAQMQNYEALIKAADTGVYLAKQAGRNCVKMGL